MASKGANLEELVRLYFDRQGFFVLRSVDYKYDDELITDIDVWFYGRQSASIRTRAVVDVKNKRSPKAFERIMWVRGVQMALGCDRAIVATTDGGDKVVRFANQQKVALLPKGFLVRLHEKLDTSGRMTLEEFRDNIQSYKEHKQDGDWLKQISDAKSAIISLHGYPAFNKAIAAFSFFAERAETRTRQKEQALRAAFHVAAIACIALDSALERVVYEDQASRYAAIKQGVTYGDGGDARVQTSINAVLDVISDGMENGRVISKQVRDTFDSIFESVRSDIIAEYFTKEHHAAVLVSVARELDNCAHSSDSSMVQNLSIEAKSIIGIFADFVQAKRSVLFSANTSARAHSEPNLVDSIEKPSVQNAGDSEKKQEKLL